MGRGRGADTGETGRQCLTRPVHEQATRAWLLEALGSAEVVDACCHGEFDPLDFLRSRLLLAKGERLTLGEMLGGETRMEGLRLLILSACQTAILDLRGARDEVRSLAAGMLQAGAQAVLGAQWSVDDKATYLLMTRFAQEWFPCATARRQPRPSRGPSAGFAASPTASCDVGEPERAPGASPHRGTRARPPWRRHALGSVEAAERVAATASLRPTSAPLRRPDLLVGIPDQRLVIGWKRQGLSLAPNAVNEWRDRAAKWRKNAWRW